ncbi:MAG TPA: hypothetical protein VHA52_01560, partial [Candidatus Babeliaceae bacterium]|nr:hypothetical protein [Candidatus Babeliaceae bacterium]
MLKLTVKGKLEVICGSMFSGKSEELIRRLRRAEFAQLTVQVFKHTLDNRKTIDHIHAHNGHKLSAIAVGSANELEALSLESADIIGIDEAQFFN